MRPPVEHVRVSAKSKDILIKIKRNTGVEHWNVLCRVALCRSLANPAHPLTNYTSGESSIDIEWKTFAGVYQEEFAALVTLRAQKDGIDISKKESISDYFRALLERGISSLHNIKDISELNRIA